MSRTVMTRNRALTLSALATAGAAGLWLWARRKARAFEDRDALLEPAPGKRIEIDGASLCYEEHGAGPALVLIHGLGASTYTWRYNIDGLARDFRVVAVDLLGFGHSQRLADADYSLTGHARRLALLLERLGIDQAVIVGHSLGGLVALHFAERYPQRVRGLVLVAPATPREAQMLAWARYVAALRPFFYAFGYQSRAVRRRVLATLYADPAVVSDEVVEQYLGLARFKGHQEALARLIRGVARDPALDLTRFAVPVLLLWGERDRLVPPQRARWLLARLPAARFVKVPRAGHMLPEEQPDEFNRLVAAFAAREAAPVAT